MKKLSQKISDFLLSLILTLIYFIGFGFYFLYFKLKKLFLKENSSSYWRSSPAETNQDAHSLLESLKRQA